MATTILFNDNENLTNEKLKFIDSFRNTQVFYNLRNENFDIFREENYKTYDINDSYDYRPDKVAYEVYGEDFYYPIILLSNNISTITEFRTDKIGNTIKYLDPDYLNKLVIK